jgi:hypothetical protein
VRCAGASRRALAGRPRRCGGDERSVTSRSWPSINVGLALLAGAKTLASDHGPQALAALRGQSIEGGSSWRVALVPGRGGSLLGHTPANSPVAPPPRPHIGQVAARTEPRARRPTRRRPRPIPAPTGRRSGTSDAASASTRGRSRARVPSPRGRRRRSDRSSGRRCRRPRQGRRRPGGWGHWARSTPPRTRPGRRSSRPT